MTLSVISAYGPQESATTERKIVFWTYLTEEAHRAKSQGKGLILQGDLNAWLGPLMIKGDLHEQNRNGKLFSSFLKENNLTCVNSLPLTDGVITRSRTYLGKEKKSTIDFCVVCESVLSFVRSLQIEDGKEHMLTKFKKGEKAVNSDHKPLIMDVLLKVPPIKKAKVEIIDFKDTNSQENSKKSQSETTNFTNYPDSLQPMHQQANKWLNTLKSHCCRAFKKSE